MIIAEIQLKGASPLSFSKHLPEKPAKEDWAEYEERIWKDKCHYNEKGNVTIPAIMIKNCISEAAKYLGKRIEGKNRQTWTKHFEAGILVENDIDLKIKKSQLKNEWLFVPSNGQKGGGTRVDKCFPRIEHWDGETTVAILDETITRDVFEGHLVDAGRFIGIGRFRPRVGGGNGRFEAKVISWKKE